MFKTFFALARGAAAAAEEELTSTRLVKSRRFVPLFWCQFFSAFNDNFPTKAPAMRNRWTLLFMLMHIAGLNGAATAQTLDQQRCFAPGAGGDTIGACTAIIQSGQETPENLAKAFSSRGFAYLLKGQSNGASQDFDQAIQDYDQAIRLNPDDAVNYNRRGNAYSGKGQSERAIEDYGQAIRLDPKYAFAFNNRGGQYAARGQSDRAIEDFDQAIRLIRITLWLSTIGASPTMVRDSMAAPRRTTIRRSGSTPVSCGLQVPRECL